MPTRGRRRSTTLLSQISRRSESSGTRVPEDCWSNSSTKLGEDDPEVTRIRTLLDFMEGEK